MFPCVNGTAFGTPVVPDVYIRSARSSGLAGGGAAMNSGGVGVLDQSSKEATPSNPSKGRKPTTGILRPSCSHAAWNFVSDAGETNASFASESPRNDAN